MAETIAKIIKIVFDFESADSSSINNSMQTIRATRELKKNAPMEHRKNSIVHNIVSGAFSHLAKTYKYKQPIHLKSFNNYEGLTDEPVVSADDIWEWDDYVQFGLGTIDGAMSALPTGNSGLYCNKNSTLARTYLTTTMTYFAKDDTKNGMMNFNNMITLSDEISHNCYYFFSPYLTLNYKEFFAGNVLLENLLYNVGYMFTDVMTIIEADPNQVSNYPYLLASNIGDFIIRIFYRDTSLQ